MLTVSIFIQFTLKWMGFYQLKDEQFDKNKYLVISYLFISL